MAKKPLISTVTINYNGKKLLKKCLRSIFKEKGNYEVVLIDNGSTDNSLAEVRKEFRGKENLEIYRLEKNIGPAAARNLGVKKSRGKYTLILDNDTIIHPGWFKKIPTFFKRHPQAGLVQPKLLTMGTNKYNYAGDYLTRYGFLAERAQSSIDKGQFDDPAKIFSYNTASVYFPKKLFLKLGGYDEDYFFYWEEPDLCFRAWLKNHQVWFDPAITVEHAFGQPVKEKNYQKTNRANKAAFYGCRNMLTTLIKNLSFKELLLVLPANLTIWILLSVLFLFKGNPQKTTNILRGIFQSFKELSLTLKKRAKIQKTRRLSEKEIFNLVGSKKQLSWYFKKALSYLLGKPF